MKYVSMPASVQSIGDDVFRDCDHLRSVTIARNSELQSIGNNTFHGCISLESLTIPASVTRIMPNAFVVCLDLTLTIERGNEPLIFGENAFQGILNKSVNLVYTGNDPGSFKIVEEETGFSITDNRLTWEGDTREATLIWQSTPGGVPEPGEDTHGSTQESFLFRCPDCRLRHAKRAEICRKGTAEGCPV